MTHMHSKRETTPHHQGNTEIGKCTAPINELEYRSECE